jgi:hypothetical protein
MNVTSVLYVLVGTLLYTDVTVDASFTVWLTPTGVLLLEKSLLPEYNAVIVRVPTGRFVRFTDACPFTKATVPSVVTPSKNRTVPVGVPLPLPDAATTAVIVAISPNTDVADPCVTPIVVEDFATVCVTVFEVLVAYAAVPAYTAVMLCPARVSVLTDTCACPLPSSVTGPPMATSPS